MVHVPLVALLAPYALGVLVADVLAPPPAGALGATALALALAVLGPARLRRVAETALATSLGALSLAVRLHAPCPDPGPGTALLTLVSPPETGGFDCRLRVFVHGDLPGRALLRAPAETCGWLPGQQAMAQVELEPLRPATNPGGRSPRRYWARRGFHRTGRVREGRIAPFGEPRGARATVERVRRRIGDVLDPGGALRSGPLLRALVTGDRSRLEDPVRAPLERSGTAHLLAVSGLHVGWVFAVGRLLLLGALYPWPLPLVQRSRRRVAFGLGLALAGAYGLLAGASVPTLRAIAMAVAGGVAYLGGRRTAGWNALAAAALVVLSVAPASLFDPSFALSFVAVAGILLWRPQGSWVGRLAGCTVGAGLATAPLLAQLGLPLPLLGILANLALVPWFGAVVLPLGLASGVGVFLVPEQGEVLASIARAAAEIGLRAAELLESPDLLRSGIQPSILGALGAGVLAVRVRLRGAYPLAGALWLLAALLLVIPLLSRPGTWGGAQAELLSLDVGQGDATLLHVGPHWWLVDAGPRVGRFDAGRAVVLPALRAEGVARLDVLLLTHADRDHVGGASAVIERVPIGEIWLTPQTLYDPSFQRIRRLAASRRIGVRLVGQGDQTSLGDWSVRVLWPPRRLGRVGRNEGGVVLRIDGPRGCVLLPGDAPIAVEDRLAPSIGPCPVLKLGHHGSETSTGPGWLTALEPHLALVSASPSLHARFPGARLRKRLRAAGVTLYETSRWGAVRVGLGLPSPVVSPYRTEPLALKPPLLADR